MFKHRIVCPVCSPHPTPPLQTHTHTEETAEIFPTSHILLLIGSGPDDNEYWSAKQKKEDECIKAIIKNSGYLFVELYSVYNVLGTSVYL